MSFWKGPHIPLSFAPTQFGNKQMDCVSTDRSCFPLVWLVNQKSPGFFSLAQQVFTYAKYKSLTGRLKGCLNFLCLYKSSKLSKTKKCSFFSIKMKDMCKRNVLIFCSGMVCISICTKVSKICTPFAAISAHSVILFLHQSDIYLYNSVQMGWASFSMAPLKLVYLD